MKTGHIIYVDVTVRFFLLLFILKSAHSQKNKCLYVLYLHHLVSVG